MSESVFQAARSDASLAFADLGPRSLKNVPAPVRVYRVGRGAEQGSPGTPRGVAAHLPAKPSIVVLPFTNMSELPEQEHFADGMTEDLITALSRVREMLVLSRHSSFFFKGRSLRLEEVARELGVRYLLEGSVRVAGGRVRVTAQLIDGQSGAHIWADRFDGRLDDIFGFQDQITRQIAIALQIRLTYGELARLWEGQTQDLRAWEKMVLARDHFLRFNLPDNRSARRLLEEALAIDPGPGRDPLPARPA